ncbi:MAG: sigma-54 dependent transcriptional regulator [Pirellulales bacterium]
MQEVFKAIGRVADSDVNVLLLGKAVSVRNLSLGPSISTVVAEKSFLAINCAAIPEALLESELFGHEKGAFTGADRQRIGKFEQATGGTIFLDEIGDMSPATQAKVLRLLQDQRFERVGGKETIQTDVRVIAATNQNLVELVASGRFRQDLFYRLNTYTIAIPPLRARRDDIPLLASHFVSLHAREVGKSIRSVAAETLTELSAYPWPGNVRELQGVVKSSLVNATSDVLTPECLPHTVRQGIAESFWPQSQQRSQFDLGALVDQLVATRSEDAYRKILLASDRVILERVLNAVNGNQVEASRLLGISRTTLRAKLQALAADAPADTSPLPDKPDQ